MRFFPHTKFFAVDCDLRLAHFILLFILAAAFAYENIAAADSFYGKITVDGVNVRADSNVNSQMICSVKKSEMLEIVSERYGWYKIKLPKSAPAFVKKDLVSPVDSAAAKVSKDNVNIRLTPDTSAAILGRVDKNEIVNIVEDKGDWYKIEPTGGSFGWIHGKFIEKIVLAPVSVADKPQSADIPSEQDMLLEGIIQPYGKVINRPATHKLITKDYNIFLLKGSSNNLNTFIYHKVRITGKELPVSKQKYPVIEITKMEVLD